MKPQTLCQCRKKPTNRPLSTINKGTPMDILLPLLLIVFFALCAAYLKGMDKL
ncbi:hypothetical protein [Deinococcus piscis]|uniref:hypothetical protein n=1 Tax=Deinococcus piscis TaxID=394230 RepID=UPI001E4CB3F6|nr:hypothetical protein [Deinococcus piscis]